MTYETPQALRAALEQRLRNRSIETGVSLDRLRRRVLFERIVARLQAVEPGRWVLKGGMALEVRLGNDARLTKDVDLGLRDDVEGPEDLHDRLVAALAIDQDGDRFELHAGYPEVLSADRRGHVTWRVKVAGTLAGKPFGVIQLDISPRAHELVATDHLPLPNSLDFAGVPATTAEIVDVNRHAAEKFHAMLRDFGDRDNSRVRDLVDLVLLIEHDLLTAPALAASARDVWAERDGAEPPPALPVLPQSWPGRYERLAAEHQLESQSFSAAQALLGRLWTEMFPSEEP